MSKRDKHLNFDLDFLNDKSEPKESGSIGSQTQHKKKGETLQNLKYGTQNFFGNLLKIIGVIVVIVFFVWIAFSDDTGGSTSTSPSPGTSSSSSCNEAKLESLGPSIFEKSELEALEDSLNSSSVTEYSSQYLINQYNADLADYNSKREIYNEKIDEYNSYLNTYCK